MCRKTKSDLSLTLVIWCDEVLTAEFVESRSHDLLERHAAGVCTTEKDADGKVVLNAKGNPVRKG